MKPKHIEDWDARAMLMRSTIQKAVFGGFPSLPPPASDPFPWIGSATYRARTLLQPEPGLPMEVRLSKSNLKIERKSVCILLDFNGNVQALNSDLAVELTLQQWLVVTPDLRGTGATKPQGDAIGGSPDHNSTEHALWMGRPLLGQWVFDVQRVIEWLPVLKEADLKRVAVIGVGQAGIIALAAGALLGNRLWSVAAIDSPISYVTDQPFAAGMRMGLLAPGILKVGDVPHLAALAAPRKLQIIGGVKPQGGKAEGKELAEAFAFTKTIYGLHKGDKNLVIRDSARAEDIVAAL
jgi:pimeloyl-ACP methyl ester carboxylesterase